MKEQIPQTDRHIETAKELVQSISNAYGPVAAITADRIFNLGRQSGFEYAMRQVNQIPEMVKAGVEATND